MKKRRKSLSAGPILLLITAVVLLLGSTVGSTRAALTYYSDNYAAQMEIANIGVSLTENGEEVAKSSADGQSEESGALLKHLQEQDKIAPGKKYEEVLGVTNSGSIDAYVRVILTKSWIDEKGEKDTELSPDLIDLHIMEGNGWVVDEKASTAERTILYYTGIVPAGANTPELTDTIRIDNAVAGKVTEKTSVDDVGNAITKYVYQYDGYQFLVDAEVQAVQTHSAQEAIKSAWGVDVSVGSDGTISLQ